jgi:hypothetical protein
MFRMGNDATVAERFQGRAGGKEAVGNAAAPAVGSLRSARKQ